MNPSLTKLGTFKISKVNRLSLGHLFCSLFFLLFCSGVLPLAAQTSNVNPSGFYELGAYDSNGNYLGLLANSDTLISIPFTRPPAFTGTIASVSGNVITVTAPLSGSVGWTANQFVYAAGSQTNTYYAWLGPNTSPANPKEGATYLITANGTNTLTLSLNGDTISSVPAGSQITVIPYWTLNTLFPASNANVSFTPTATIHTYMTEILIPDYAGSGINLSSPTVYYFINSGSNIGWRMAGDLTTTDHGNDVLIPDGYITVRNQNGAPTLPLLLTGAVPMLKLRVSMATLSSGPQDTPTAIIRPLDVTLNNCGLNTSDGSLVATTSIHSYKDQILMYNNSQVGFNKSAPTVYYYMNSAWRLEGDLPTTNHGGDLIPAGSAIKIRKAASTGQTAFWTNAPTY